MTDNKALIAEAEQRFTENRIGKSWARETDKDLAILRRVLDALEATETPRTVTTVEELRALPVGAVIRSAEFDSFTAWRSEYGNWVTGYVPGGGEDEDVAESPYMPVIVLFAPEVTR